MQFLDSFGEPVYRYDGVGTLGLETSQNRRNIEVSYEVRQLADGLVVVGWLTHGFFISSEIRTLVGWVRQPRGRIEVRGLVPIQSEIGFPGVRFGIARAHDARLEVRRLSKPMSSRAVFSMVNLTSEPWERNDFPFSVSYGNYRLSFSPLPGYQQVVERLCRVPGTAVTARCVIERQDGAPIKPARAAQAVDSVSWALSLATGTKVVWSTYETASGDRLHRSSTTRPYSHRLAALGWRLDVDEAVSSWERAGAKPHLRPMIDYFMDATAEGPYLQTKALTAASLLDALTNHWCVQNGLDLLVGDTLWRQAQPKLRRAIRQAAANHGIDESIAGNVKSLQRRPFADKLERLLRRLNIQSDHLRDLVRLRNSLVHDGDFPPGVDRVRSYHQLVWTDLAILARLAGYKSTIFGM